MTRHASGTATPEERALVESHLSECERCTEEMIAAWRFARARPNRRGGWIAAGAAVAALLAGVLLWPATGTVANRSHPAIRGSDQHGLGQALAIVSPGDRAVVRDNVALIWRPRPDVTTYKLSVTDRDGDSVFAVVTNDTVVNLPPTLRLQNGASYFWYVDALLEAGQGVTSGVHEFRMSP